MDKETQDMLNDLPNKKFAKLTDNQLAGIEVMSQKMRGENNPIHKMKKNPFSDPEFIKKNSEKAKNRKASDETRKKISDSAKNRKASNETRKKMSVKRKGVPKNLNHITKIAKSNTGKKRSEEHCKMMSETRKGNPAPHTSKTNNKMNSLKFICPYCGREIGGRANFVRFHNENCKNK
jgi:predicted RNA-binding Zn-ribbon protein involved in translation (DUF1610 family)